MSKTTKIMFLYMMFFLVLISTALASTSLDVSVTEALVNQPFDITVTAEDTKYDIIAISIEHNMEGDWQPVACDTGRTCTQTWTFTETSEGIYTFRVVSLNTDNNKAIHPFDVEVTLESQLPLPECNDGLDNDNDGFIDENDPGCYDTGVYDPNDDNETDVVVLPECNDGIDNDADGFIDENDPGCYDTGVYDPNDDDETDPIVLPECNDGLDNDNDGFIDENDPGCYNGGVYDANDDDETDLVEPLEVTLTANPTQGEELLDVDFICGVNGGVLPYDYTTIEDFGAISGVDLAEGVVDNVYEFSRTYAEGIVNVTCMVTDSDGSTDSDSVIITITEQPLLECNDGLDNDGDSLIDFPADLGCTDINDDNETDIFIPPALECNDGLDNDGDGLIDLLDLGCVDINDNNETDEITPDVDLAPIVSILAPADGTVLDTNNITAEYIVTDDISAELSCGVFYLDGTELVQAGDTQTATNNTVMSIDFTNLPNDVYTWNVACVDEALNMGTNPTNFTLTIDVPVPVLPECNDGLDNDGDGLIDLADLGCTDANDDNETDEITPDVDLAPVVSIISPADGAVLTVDYATVEYTVTDDISAELSCGVFYLDGTEAVQAGQTQTAANDTLMSMDFTNIPNGVYTWNVACVDEAWNLATNPTNFTLTIDVPVPVLPECNDGIDNDGDILIDFPADLGCTDINDDNETDIVIPPAPECSDLIDNDGDGLIDLLDAGCVDVNDNNETDEITPVIDLSPVVTIISPADGDVLNTNNVTAEYIVIDDISAELNCGVFYLNGTEVEQAGNTQTAANDTLMSMDFTNIPNGVYTWNVACVDEAWNMGTNPTNFTITIDAPVNQAPVFDPMDNITVTEGQMIMLFPSATDPDGDDVTITAANLPPGSLFMDEMFFWVPNFGTTGTFTVTFTASDGDLETSIDVTITVNDIPSDQEMTVMLTADALSGTDMLNVSFTCAVANGEAPYAYSYSITDWEQGIVFMHFHWPDNNAAYDFNKTLPAGNWTAVCGVTDDNGTIGISNNLTITIDALPEDNETVDLAPVVTIISPLDGAEFNETNNITIEYFVVDDISTDLRCGVFVLNGTEPVLAGDYHDVLNNTLVQRDFTNVPNGTYIWNVACVDEAWNLGMNPTNFTGIINYVAENNTGDDDGDDQDDDDDGQGDDDNGNDNGGSSDNDDDDGGHSTGNGIWWIDGNIPEDDDDHDSGLLNDEDEDDDNALTGGQLTDDDNIVEGDLTITGDVVAENEGESVLSARTLWGLLLLLGAIASILWAGYVLFMYRLRKQELENPEMF